MSRSSVLLKLDIAFMTCNFSVYLQRIFKLPVNKNVVAGKKDS